MASGYDVETSQHHKVGKRSGAQKIVDLFNTNDIDDVSSSVLYLGSVTVRGEWLVTKYDLNSPISIRYATVVNNPGVLEYDDAWTDRATLVYETFKDALFVENSINV